MLHASAREAHGEASSYQDPAYLDFQRDAARLLVLDGRLTLVRLKIDGRPVTVMLALTQGRVGYFYSVGYDPGVMTAYLVGIGYLIEALIEDPPKGILKQIRPLLEAFDDVGRITVSLEFALQETKQFLCFVQGSLACGRRTLFDQGRERGERNTQDCRYGFHGRSSRDADNKQPGVPKVCLEAGTLNRALFSS